jgi:hypothetical protein
MNERKYDSVAPIALTQDGLADGTVSVGNSEGFFVKSQAILASDTIPEGIAFQIQSVPDKNTIVLGPLGSNLNGRADVSSFLVADNATIQFPANQLRPNIPFEQHSQFTYQQEPVVANRVINVDPYGKPYSGSNPIPTINASDGVVWTRAELTYDVNNNLEIVRYYNVDVLEQTVTITYDVNNNITEVEKS